MEYNRFIDFDANVIVCDPEVLESQEDYLIYSELDEDSLIVYDPEPDIEMSQEELNADNLICEEFDEDSLIVFDPEPELEVSQENLIICDPVESDVDDSNQRNLQGKIRF